MIPCACRRAGIGESVLQGVEAGRRLDMKFVLLPAKRLEAAKTRLGALLLDRERQALAFAMYRDVLGAVARCASRPRVVVVTSDPRLRQEAAGYGFTAVAEEPPYGLNRAVGLGTRVCMGMGASTVATLLTDTPLIEPADVDELLEEAGRPGSILLVSSKEGTGTNALVRTPPDAITSSFGPSSLERHLAKARARGLAVRYLRRGRIEFDIDTPEDLAELVRRQGHSAARHTACEMLARILAAQEREA